MTEKTARARYWVVGNYKHTKRYKKVGYNFSSSFLVSKARQFKLPPCFTRISCCPSVARWPGFGWLPIGTKSWQRLTFLRRIWNRLSSPSFSPKSKWRSGQRDICCWVSKLLVVAVGWVLLGDVVWVLLVVFGWVFMVVMLVEYCWWFLGEYCCFCWVSKLLVVW